MYIFNLPLVTPHPLPATRHPRKSPAVILTETTGGTEFMTGLAWYRH